MNLNDEIVNKVIAEFMGNDLIEKYYSTLYVYENQRNKNILTKESLEYGLFRGFFPDMNLYTEDLNALVPVWEKLAIENFVSFPQGGHFKICKHIDQDTVMSWSIRDNKLSLQQAAAYATAKCIMELEK